jgi:hypothetical protein
MTFSREISEMREDRGHVRPGKPARERGMIGRKPVDLRIDLVKKRATEKYFKRGNFRSSPIPLRLFVPPKIPLCPKLSPDCPRDSGTTDAHLICGIKEVQTALQTSQPSQAVQAVSIVPEAKHN